MAIDGGPDLPTLRRGLSTSLLLLCVILFEVSSRCDATSRGIQIEARNFRRSALTSGAARNAAHQDAPKSMHITSSCELGTRCPRTTHSAEWKPDTMQPQMVHVSSRPGSSATIRSHMSGSGSNNPRNAHLEKSRRLREDVAVKISNSERMRNSESMRDFSGKMNMDTKDPAEANGLRNSEWMTDLHRQRNLMRSDDGMVIDQQPHSGMEREFNDAMVNIEGHESSRKRDIKEGSKWGVHGVDHENKRGIEFESEGSLESKWDGIRDAAEVEKLLANGKMDLDTRENQMRGPRDMRARDSSQAIMGSAALNSRESNRFVSSDTRRGVWIGDGTQMGERAATLRESEHNPMGMGLETHGQSNEMPISEKSADFARKGSAHSDMWRGGDRAFINSDRSRDMEGSQERSMNKWTGSGADFEGMQGYLSKSKMTRESNMMRHPSDRRRDLETQSSGDWNMQNEVIEKQEKKRVSDGKNQIPSHHQHAHDHESEMMGDSEWMPLNRMKDADRGSDFHRSASGDLGRTMNPTSNEMRDMGVMGDSQPEWMSAATSAHLRNAEKIMRASDSTTHHDVESTVAKALSCEGRSCNNRDGDAQRMDSTIQGSDGMRWQSRDSVETEMMRNNRGDAIFQSEANECGTQGADCRVVRDGRNRATKNLGLDQESMMDTSSSNHETVPNSCGPNRADCQHTSAHEGNIGSRMIGQGPGEDQLEGTRFRNTDRMSSCNGQCRKFKDTDVIVEEHARSMHTGQMDKDMMGFEKISNADPHAHWTSSDLERRDSKIIPNAEKMRSSSERLPTTYSAAGHEEKSLVGELDHGTDGMGHTNKEMMKVPGSKNAFSDQHFGPDLEGAELTSGQDMDRSFSHQSNIETEMTGPRMEASVWGPNSARNKNLESAHGSKMIESELTDSESQAGMSRAGNVGNSCPNGMKCGNEWESHDHVVHVSFKGPRYSNPEAMHTGHSSDSGSMHTGAGSMEMSEKRSTITVDRESLRSDRTGHETMDAEPKNNKDSVKTTDSNNNQIDWTRKASQAQQESHM